MKINVAYLVGLDYTLNMIRTGTATEAKTAKGPTMKIAMIIQADVENIEQAAIDSYTVGGHGSQSIIEKGENVLECIPTVADSRVSLSIASHYRLNYKLNGKRIAKRNIDFSMFK